ncbi:MAG: exonuclease domain-containing protein [Actinomycetaceae bacterium]|nr:exonuclease domain-containing protein [Actinomycetaceae bacterium]
MHYRPQGVRTPELGKRLELPVSDTDGTPPDQQFYDDVWAHTYIVVDLETTGLSSADAITEIGAVKIRHAKIVETFSTLVNSGVPVPPKITALTGITTSMTQSGLTPREAITQFFEFAQLDTSILIAHNAEFDCGFLSRAASAHGIAWVKPRTIDTLALARTVLPRPIVSSHSLPVLARFFAVATPQAHRALADAYTCADVFAGLVKRLEEAGARSFDDVMVASQTVPYRHRKKVSLAHDLPTSAGVYTFWGESEVPLYIGSATNCRSRVRSYFSSSEKRRRICAMLDQVTRVSVQPTTSTLEARIEELRAIRTQKPLYNSASRHQKDTTWLTLRDRQLLTTHVLTPQEAPYALGPYRHTRHALKARQAILLALDQPYDFLRSLSAQPTSVADEKAVLSFLQGRGGRVPKTLTALMTELSQRSEYEQAATIRDYLAAYFHGVKRQRDTALIGRADLVVWAHHLSVGGWRIHAASRGKLLDSQLTAPKTSPAAVAKALSSLAPLPDSGAYLADATWEEVRVISRDLFSDTARLIEWRSDDPWAFPADSDLRELIRWPSELTSNFRHMS